VSQCAFGQLERLEKPLNDVRPTAVLLFTRAVFLKKITRGAQMLDCSELAMTGAFKWVVPGGGPDELQAALIVVGDGIIFVAPPQFDQNRNPWTLGRSVQFTKRIPL
jgi:hypothetical protein